MEENNAARNRVNTFLASLQETRHSTNQARIRLSRKLVERAKLLEKRKSLQRRMRKIAKDLETLEGLVDLTDMEIQTLEQAVEQGSDGED